MVRTVLGDIDPGDLGRTDYHEHLFQVSPLLVGDELDDEERSGAEAKSLYEAGMQSMVDATPMGLGRNPCGLARISELTGLRVVATTGLHREAHYGADHWVRELTEQQLVDRFVSELTVGQPINDGPSPGETARAPSGATVRAGLLKAGISYWSWTAFERRTLAAVATAHVATGAPVMVHLEHGSAAHEVLDVLAGDGVPPSSVVLAHMDRNPDAGLLIELASRGAYLGCDGMARHRDWPDSALIDLLVRLVESGMQRRLVLGGDVARAGRYLAYGGMPGLRYLPDRFVPRVLRATSSAVVDEILVRNPAGLLAWLPTYKNG